MYHTLLHNIQYTHIGQSKFQNLCHMFSLGPVFKSLLCTYVYKHIFPLYSNSVRNVLFQHHKHKKGNVMQELLVGLLGRQFKSVSQQKDDLALSGSCPATAQPASR